MPGFSLILDFWFLEGRVFHKGAWVATLLVTLFGVQDYKKVKFPGRDISSLAAKGLKKKYENKKFNEKQIFHHSIILLKPKAQVDCYEKNLFRGQILTSD